MTKEQIVHHELNGEEIDFFGDNMGNIFDCMEIYKDQELAKERERAAKLVELLKEYKQWEADLIADNAMWWPSVPKDRISGKTYDTMLILQNKRNELLKA